MTKVYCLLIIYALTAGYMVKNFAIPSAEFVLGQMFPDKYTREASSPVFMARSLLLNFSAFMLVYGIKSLSYAMTLPEAWQGRWISAVFRSSVMLFIALGILFKH